MHSFMAGSIAGAAGTFIGHPLDTLKVYVQAGAGRPPTLASLFRGVSTPVLTAGALQALNLGLYENIRRSLSREVTPPLWTHVAAGSAAGLCISPVTVPLSRIKVQQQLTGQSFLQTARSIGSVRSLYAGGTATTLFESTRGFYMLVYSVLKRGLNGGEPEGARPLPLWARTVAGAGANVVAWGVIYPIDVVRNVQQAQAARARADHAAPCEDARACVRRLWREGGAGRFYRGYLFTLVRAGPVAGVLLPCFEIVLPWLERRF